MFGLVTRRRYRLDVGEERARANRAIEEAADCSQETRVAREVQRFQIGQRHHAVTEKARMRQLLDQSEQARRRLDAVCVELQAANEAMCRELVDAAGTLAPEQREVTA